MSKIDHPSEDKDENVNLVPSTIGFALTAVASLAGMFAIMIWNYNGGF